MNLGIIIKELRKKRGISQGELAKKCGITQAYLSQIENNKKEPHLSVLKDIGNFIEVPLPIIFFMSLNEEDILESKKNEFKIINPILKDLINKILLEV